MKRSFPLLALGVGLMISLVIAGFAPEKSGGVRQLPLLTALLMSEFGFLLNAIAAGVCVRNLSMQGFNKSNLFLLLGNLVLAINLLLTGLKLWPDVAGS